jgi:hypothetical protein
MDKGMPVRTTCLEIDNLQRRGAQPPTLPVLLSILKTMKSAPKELRATILLTSQLLAYPARGMVFERECDLLDVTLSEGAKPFVLEGRHFPEEAIGKPNIGLLITPDLLIPSEEIGAIYVRPKSITIMNNLLQTSRTEGKINPTTGIPEEVPPEVLETLPPEERAIFFRKETAGIKPLCIQVFGDGDASNVTAYFDSNQPFEVPILEVVE